MIKKLLVIPDTQVKPGVPLTHLEGLSYEILEERPDVIVHLGDHWDMPSLSSYDRGTAKAEGRIVRDDIEAGNEAMRLLLRPLRKLQEKQRNGHRRVYTPRMCLLMGNHENRIARYENSNPALRGFVDNMLDTSGWNVVPFLSVISLGGVDFSHYFYNPNSGKPFGGSMEYRLNKVKRSFVQGHEQGLKYATESVGDRKLHGLMLGSFYLHDEEYKGPQGNEHWRGHAYLRNVRDGDYDLDLRGLRR